LLFAGICNSSCCWESWFFLSCFHLEETIKNIRTRYQKEKRTEGEIDSILQKADSLAQEKKFDDALYYIDKVLMKDPHRKEAIELRDLILYHLTSS